MQNDYSKPLIATYTEIAALLTTLKETSINTVLWEYELYSNLCWDNISNTLYLCGTYNHNTYDEFENTPGISLHKLSKQTSMEELIEYIKMDFLVLLPINTKKLGITDYSYKHNVFIVGIEGDSFFVYDFWTPSFLWKCKKIKCDHLFESIDFDNMETVQSFYVFKENKMQYVSSTIDQLEQRVRSALLLYTGKLENKLYQYENSIYGMDIYDALINRIRSISVINLTDAQNIHILFEHLKFNKYCFEFLLKNDQELDSIIAIYDDIINKTFKLRTNIYKYKISLKNIEKLKVKIVEQLQYVMENESKAVTALLERG